MTGLALTSLLGSLDPDVVAGRVPRGPREVALGSTTLHALGKRIGDTVQVAGPHATLNDRIVGRVVFPSLGPGSRSPTEPPSPVRATDRFDPNNYFRYFVGDFAPGADRGRLGAEHRGHPRTRPVDPPDHSRRGRPLAPNRLVPHRPRRAPRRPGTPLPSDTRSSPRCDVADAIWPSSTPLGSTAAKSAPPSCGKPPPFTTVGLVIGSRRLGHRPVRVAPRCGWPRRLANRGMPALALLLTIPACSRSSTSSCSSPPGRPRRPEPPSLCERNSSSRVRPRRSSSSTRPSPSRRPP